MQQDLCASDTKRGWAARRAVALATPRACVICTATVMVEILVINWSALCEGQPAETRRQAALSLGACCQHRPARLPSPGHRADLPVPELRPLHGSVGSPAGAATEAHGAASVLHGPPGRSRPEAMPPPASGSLLLSSCRQPALSHACQPGVSLGHVQAVGDLTVSIYDRPAALQQSELCPRALSIARQVPSGATAGAARGLLTTSLG